MNTIISIAIACLLTTMAVHPNEDPVRAARGLETEKKWSDAAQAWERIAAANPTDPFAPLHAANDYYQAKQYDQAIEKYRAADALGVSYRWDMPYSIACCYALAGRKTDSLQWLSRAIERGFRDLELVRRDPDLTSLHGDTQFNQLAAIADTAHMGRDEGYRFDLRFANRELRRLHYSPYLRHTAHEFDEYVTKLDHDIPTLSDSQIAARFKQLYAMAGDGHTHMTTPAETEMAHKGLPVTFMTFAEGTYVISADATHKDLLGRKLVGIEGRPIADAFKAVEPICSFDNSQWIAARAPDYLRIPALLNGLGLSASADKTTLALQTSDGHDSDVTLDAGAGKNGVGWRLERDLSANPAPLTFQHRDKNYWFEALPDGKTVFAQYNAVQDMPGESIEQFSGKLFTYIADHPVNRLILDMRWNGGGDNFLNKPLLEGLIKSKVNAPGHLFVIVGRFTFSAAMCGATQIERYTNAVFAGEPTGSSPNFIGESIPVKLPYSGLSGTVSDLYWQNSTAMDHRTWISPKIYVPMRFADYSQNRDAVLDAILNYP